MCLFRSDVSEDDEAYDAETESDDEPPKKKKKTIPPTSPIAYSCCGEIQCECVFSDRTFLKMMKLMTLRPNPMMNHLRRRRRLFLQPHQLLTLAVVKFNVNVSFQIGRF